MAFITLKRENFFHNLDKIKEKTGSIEKIALVLKDNAYGHGLCEMAELAQTYGITKAVVRSDAEAEQIEHFFEYILVLAEIPERATQKRHYTINDITTVEKFPKNTKVELKVDTGMHRNGIAMSELALAFEKIVECGLELEAVFTHHGAADEMLPLYAEQKKAFREVKKESLILAKKHGIENVQFHSCNSAALFREESFSEDMARVGIAAYGCLELPEEFASVELKPVLSLYAKKIASRELKKGDSVGYGATFIAERACCVSSYDFGYGDGFLRLSSGVYETPEGVKIAGRISMDNSSFLSQKEELLLLNDARVAAKYAQTISYEVLTALKKKISRKLV